MTGFTRFIGLENKIPFLLLIQTTETGAGPEPGPTDEHLLRQGLQVLRSCEEVQLSARELQIRGVDRRPQVSAAA